MLSPQRRSFGGGCQGIAAPAPLTRRPVSPLENKENESLRLGGARRIGSGRIMAARGFEREGRVEKERERERDFKDKRFRVSIIHGYSYCDVVVKAILLISSLPLSVACQILPASFPPMLLSYPVLSSETLVTSVSSVKEEGMTPMQKKSLNGSQEVLPANQRPLSSLDLMTRFWRKINVDPSVQGSERTL